MLDFEADNHRCQICYQNYDYLICLPMVICSKFHIICQKCLNKLPVNECPYCKRNINKGEAKEFTLFFSIRQKFLKMKEKQRRLEQDIALLNEINSNLVVQQARLINYQPQTGNQKEEKVADLTKEEFYSAFKHLQSGISSLIHGFRKTMICSENVAAIASREIEIHRLRNEIQNCKLHLREKEEQQKAEEGEQEEEAEAGEEAEEDEEREQQEVEEEEDQLQVQNEQLRKQNKLLKEEIMAMKEKVIQLKATLKAEQDLREIMMNMFKDGTTPKNKNRETPKKQDEYKKISNKNQKKY